MWLCARECPLRRPRTRRSLCRRPFRCNPLRRRPFRRRLPCCRLCRLCRRLAPCCVFTHGPARGGRRFSLGSALGLARLSARLGSAQSAWSARLGTAQHGSARLSTARHGWNSRGCTHAGNDRPSRLCSAQPSSAQLSSAHLLSREVRAARLDRRTAQAYALLGSRRCSPRRRHLRAQHRPGAAQPRFSKNWAVGREGAALSLEHVSCARGEGTLPKQCDCAGAIPRVRLRAEICRIW